MLWRDFEPYVLPFVKGCPLPVLEHHARLVAQEFCKKTLCYTRTLDPIPAPGNTDQIVMEPEPATLIVKVKSVTMNDQPLTLKTQYTPGQLHAYTEDNEILMVRPAPPQGALIAITAAVAPSLTASGLNNLIASQYMQDMAPGIIAAIKRLSGEDFSDPRGAIEQESMYRARITTVAAKIMRGQLGAKMPSYGSFL